ncbi:GATA zinc finger-domain-containing protein [Phascolomyces articulosus]|uniref:GATA zinc finger-domain-containing protein n=1 Tax=Phascolomyces articulosus TaxID=60185 RepID=A0AAD5JWD5_9FUNG|nr:GATA zinc finger-domain-containing protein [Phascolomyces articulosus]
METSNLASGTSSPAIATSTTSQREPLSTSPEYVMIRRARNLQDSIGIRQSYRRRAKKTTIGQRCHSCHTTETPEWRRGPDGARTLCNACGLHYSKLIRRGSLTVQRGYSLEDGRSDRSTPPPIPPPPPPRVIEYPIQQDGSPTQLGFPNRVGLGIGSTQTSIAGSNNSQSSSIANQQQQQHSQHHTSFINYMSPPPTEPHHPRDDPP